MIQFALDAEKVSGSVPRQDTPHLNIPTPVLHHTPDVLWYKFFTRASTTGVAEVLYHSFSLIDYC